MDKHLAVQHLIEQCIVAIVRAEAGGNTLVPVMEAIAAGGVQSIEVTMTTPGALACIESAARTFADSDILLGVGSVLDAETCRMAILAGAEFIVTPTLNTDAIQMARRYGIPIIAGAYTPTEILAAWETGADFVKVFPAIIGGVAYIKALKAPLPQIALAPTGGVTPANVDDFLEAGASLLGVGNGIVNQQQIDARDFEGITANARAFADAVAEARDGK